MSRVSRGPFAKRQKELARVEKRKEKEARRAEARQLKSESTREAEGEDPDLAGIVPGPQPLAIDEDRMAERDSD